jgi:adenylate cyclase class 2
LKDAVESEVKLRMDGPAQARALVAGIGATVLRERHFEDNVLFDDASLSLLHSGRVLRLRRAGDVAVVTFKGPKIAGTGVKSRPEFEFEVKDPESVEAVLQGLGYRKGFRYQKYRECFRWKDVEIMVDETPIGTYLEIEGPVAGIHAAAAALGRGPGDYVEDPYTALFEKAGHTGDVLFR